jgi:hypothetical protein
MVRTLIEIHGELMQINVSGIDVEHMYRAMVKLTEVIRVMQEDEEGKDTE